LLLEGFELPARVGGSKYELNASLINFSEATKYIFLMFTLATVAMVCFVCLLQWKVRGRKMPIFTKKFTQKAPKPRDGRDSSVPKLTEELDDFKNIKLKLSDDKELRFVDGTWMSLKKGTTDNIDDVVKLQKQKQKLEDENSMYAVKMDIMLDLLSECVSEVDLMSKK